MFVPTVHTRISEAPEIAPLDQDATSLHLMAASGSAVHGYPALNVGGAEGSTQDRRQSNYSASTPTELLDVISERLQSSCNEDEQTGEIVFIGRQAFASYFRAMEVHEYVRSQLSQAITVEFAFGLTNRTILHPFASLWSFAGNPALGQILRTLPGPETCLT